jgi:hypothetical protein
MINFIRKQIKYKSNIIFCFKNTSLRKKKLANYKHKMNIYKKFNKISNLIYKNKLKIYQIKYSKQIKKTIITIIVHLASIFKNN